MTPHDHDDALEQKVLDAWKSLPKAEPSDALDERIMAMARRAVAAPGAAPRRRPQWPVRLALAATVVLAAGVALQVARIPRDADRAVAPSTPAPALAPAPPTALDAKHSPVAEDVPSDAERAERRVRELQKAGDLPGAPPLDVPGAPTLADKQVSPAAAAEAPAPAPVATGDTRSSNDDRPAEPAVEGKALSRTATDEAARFPAAAAPAASPKYGNAAPVEPPRAPAEATTRAEKLKSERAAGADATTPDLQSRDAESRRQVPRPLPSPAPPAPPPPPAAAAAARAASAEPAPQAATPIDAAPPVGTPSGPSATGAGAAPERRKELGLGAGEASKAKDNEVDRAVAAPPPMSQPVQPATTPAAASGTAREEGRRDPHDADARKADRGSLGGLRAAPAAPAPAAPAPKAMPAPATPAAMSKPAAPPRPLADSIDRSTPEAWILAIQRLYAIGERELAKSELARLHQTFPDAVVPADLDAALR